MAEIFQQNSAFPESILSFAPMHLRHKNISSNKLFLLFQFLRLTYLGVYCSGTFLFADQDILGPSLLPHTSSQHHQMVKKGSFWPEQSVQQGILFFLNQQPWQQCKESSCRNTCGWQTRRRRWRRTVSTTEIGTWNECMLLWINQANNCKLGVKTEATSTTQM